MLALQNVGEQLIALSEDKLAQLELPETLRDAVLAAKHIASGKHGALKRQRQYIGRVMRDVDAAPIIEQLNLLKAPSHKQNALFHLAEQWREKLLADENAINAFLADFPGVDREALWALISSAHGEQTRGAPPRHFRELFQLIHAAIVEKAGEPA